MGGPVAYKREHVVIPVHTMQTPTWGTVGLVALLATIVFLFVPAILVMIQLQWTCLMSGAVIGISAPKKACVASAFEPGLCSLCGAPANGRCARCHATSYCGGSCQRQHWKIHAASCQPVVRLVFGVHAFVLSTPPIHEF